MIVILVHAKSTDAAGGVGVHSLVVAVRPPRDTKCRSMVLSMKQHFAKVVKNH